MGEGGRGKEEGGRGKGEGGRGKGELNILLAPFLLPNKIRLKRTGTPAIQATLPLTLDRHQ